MNKENLKFEIDLSKYNFKNISYNSSEIEDIEKTLTEEISQKINRTDNEFVESYIDNTSNSEKLVIETGYPFDDTFTVFFHAIQKEINSPVFIVTECGNF